MMKRLQSHFINYDTTCRNRDPRNLRQVILINGFFIRDQVLVTKRYIGRSFCGTLSRSYSECAAPNFFLRRLTTFTEDIFLEEILKYFFLVSVPIYRHFFLWSITTRWENANIRRTMLTTPTDAVSMEISQFITNVVINRRIKKNAGHAFAESFYRHT